MTRLSYLKKRFPPFGSFILRSLLAVLLCGTVALTVTGALPTFFREASTQGSQRTLTFAERVAFQRAIEEVYWRHRIWPKENPDPKPSLDAVMSQAELENKVARYLHDSLVLENYWQKPITAEQLQAEMDRMARHTKQPDVLWELFKALGNDPAVIAECLARPILAERLITDLSAQDKTRLVNSPRTGRLGTMSLATTFGQEVVFTLPEIADAGDTPCTDDTWTATSTTNAPSARAGHTAVWTGTEMIVWGGYGTAGTGGKYHPSTNSWAATSTTNAPSARVGHTAVWTGTEMIVWGGDDGYCCGGAFTGGRYNPATDTWTATDFGPEPRADHTAVWTGSEMIIWGGYNTLISPINFLNTGGRYNPATNSWTDTSTNNALGGRAGHTAVWTGSEMIVWGGENIDVRLQFVYLNDGAKYNPATDSWIPTSMTNPPSPRVGHRAVWTGSEMIVWSGGTGGRYNPNADSWAATSTTNAPAATGTAVWTGSEMIIWGGLAAGPVFFNTGGRYNPSTDTWTATSTTNAPTARYSHTAVWTGSEMIVWGGSFTDGGNAHYVNTGGRYSAPLDSASVPVAHPATFIASNSFKANWSSACGATYRLDVATNSSFTAYVTGYHDLNVGNTTSYNVTGLNPSTVYYYRVRAYNGVGTSANSNTVDVATLPPTGAPVVVTNPATNVANSSATLNGSLDPHGLTTTVYFQYGTTDSYGRTTSSQTQAGNTYRNISANISGLAANSAYHFRMVATNSAGTTYGADKVFTLVPNDFNTDGRPDCLLYNSSTQQTALWYLNNNVVIDSSFGPTLPASWQVVGVADFNRGGRPDYLLFNPTIRGTVIWYMNNNVRIGSTWGPTLPSGWGVGALADFNGDGYPDYLLYNASTGGTVVWYMRNNVHIGSALGPAIPAGWILAGVADFDGDGHADYLLFNPTTRGTAIFYMNNNVNVSGAYGPTPPAGWQVAGVADFNRDGHPDYLLFNPATRGTVIWYMNNNVHVGGIHGPTLPAGWSLVAP